MKIGAEDTDAYLSEWRKGTSYQVEGDQTDIAKSEATRIENEYDQDKIKKLIANDGWAQ